MDKMNVKTCAICGCVIEDNDTHYPLGDNEGVFICGNCVDDVNYFLCVDCETVHPTGEEYELYNGHSCFEGYICDDCRCNGSYTYCERCGQMYRSENTDYVRYNHNGRYDICYSCLEELHYCDECNTYVDDDRWHEGCECCTNCVPDLGEIEDYHSNHGHWQNFGKDSDLRFGIELEVEHKDDDPDHSEMVYKLRELFGNHVVYEHDGSLNEGFEIITHPHTEKAFAELPWEEALKLLAENDYRSHDTRTCGLHIHVGRNWFGNVNPWSRSNEEREAYYTNIAKICYLYNVKYPFFLKVSRRTEANANRWAARYISGNFEDTKGKVKDDCNARYSAVNLNNCDTVEFRLGRGTLKYESFMAWIDIHLTIVRNVDKIEEADLTNLAKWLDGIKPETSKWLEERGIDIYNTVSLPVDEYASIDDFAEDDDDDNLFL